MFFGHNDIEDFFPLRWAEIASCWVVGASVKQYHRGVWGVFEIADDSIEVYSFCGWIVIVVVFQGNSGKSSHCGVVWPGWVWAVELGAWSVSMDEVITDSKSSGSG